jgi:hypothetical protein
MKRRFLRARGVVPVFAIGSVVVTVTYILVASIRAAAPDAARPYDYRVILRVASHRLLTGPFCNQLRSDLQDGVQAALSPLAQADVVFAGNGVNDKWLELKSLESHTQVTSEKRHFVDVSYADGGYVVRARQIDGATGFASPMVREAKTPFRSFVSRLIIGFIAEDFGPIGTVVGFDKGSDKVELALQGGGLDPPALARMVPTGSVFALTRVGGTPPRGRPLDAAYLVTLAAPADGRCECRFVYRFGEQLNNWVDGSYKAIKLGTGRGPVRLRLISANGLPPSGLQVQVSADGFRPDRAREEGVVRDGIFESGHPYVGIAYALITSGSHRVAQIPVPIVGERVTTCRVNTAPGGEARQRSEMDINILTQRLADIYRRLVAQHVRLARLTDAKSHAEALAEVGRGLDRLDGELPMLSSEVVRLKGEAANLDPTLASGVEQCDTFVREIRKQRERLLQDQRNLQDALENERKQEPERNDFLSLLHRADNQRLDADFDGALKTYDELLNRFGEREEVRKKKDDLERQWKVKGEAHREARTFIYQTWPNVRTVEDVERNLPKARDALAVCKQVGDRLTPLKLLLSASTQTEIVARAVEETTKSESDADRLNLPKLQKLSGELGAFITDVEACVRPEEARKP